MVRFCPSKYVTSHSVVLARHRGAPGRHHGVAGYRPLEQEESAPAHRRLRLPRFPL